MARSRPVFVLSWLRWLIYNLAPAGCPDCGGWLSPVLRRTPRELHAVLDPDDPQADRPSDWLCCEDCLYAVSLDLATEPDAGDP